ncbi:MAG TPA: NADPH:quinone oxidoreductase family protein [Mycobacteriales bacterium]|nr:NADPH:quinone oxidoreductase family protein [Mycobacteriales bacterium]
MRAAVCSAYGGPDALTIDVVEVPSPGPGEVRVAVDVAAVNFPDVLVLAGQYQIKVPPPFVLGSEFAGVVSAVGDAVTEVAVGDRVFGSCLVGAFAEQVVVPASGLMPVPDGVSTDVAAGFGVAHRTAYHSLRSVGRLAAGEELVVLGAGGGVGLAAVQLGALLGATVTAVASTPDKLAAAEACGATRLAEHRGADLRQVLKELVPGGADVVIDPVGGALSEPALRSLRRDGRFVVVGFASGEIPRIPLNLVLLKGIEVVGFEFRGWAAAKPQELSRNDAELLDLLAAGKVAPYVGARFAFDDVAESVRHVAEGKAIGKVLLDVGQPIGCRPPR